MNPVVNRLIKSESIILLTGSDAIMLDSEQTNVKIKL